MIGGLWGLKMTVRKVDVATFVTQLQEYHDDRGTLGHGILHTLQWIKGFELYSAKADVAAEVDAAAKAIAQKLLTTPDADILVLSKGRRKVQRLMHQIGKHLPADQIVKHNVERLVLAVEMIAPLAHEHRQITALPLGARSVKGVSPNVMYLLE